MAISLTERAANHVRQFIAKRGKGRIFYTDKAEELPSIFSQETVAVARSAFIMEPVPTKAAGGWFEISSQAFEWPKEVDGFNLSYLRDWASQALITQDEYAAPLVAFGPRGTGRTAAVSFPLGGEHSQRVRDWPKYGDFLQTQVRWLMGETVPPGIGVRHRIDGNTLTLDLLYDEEWEPKLRAKAPRVVLAHGLRAEGSHELAWERVAPGHFQTSTELPEGEMVRGAVQVGGQAISFGPAIVGTSTEWAFDESRVEELRRVSQTSGGRELLEMSQAWRSPTIPRFIDLGLYLLIAALLLMLFEAFVTRTLGKGVVRAKDTPNFVANRVGTAGMLATIVEAAKVGLGYDVVDDLTGKKLGRASSGTFRTADVVGIDTLAHVVKTMQDNLQADPFYASYATPDAVAKLIAAGALGQKTGAGFYKKVGKDILQFSAATGEYVKAGGKADAIVDRILKKPAGERLKLLRESTNPQAQFLWAIQRNAFHYVAVHLADIAESAREVDLAMRWGFGMKQGPFELWQEAGWQQVAKWVQEDIDAGKALCNAPLPAWVFDGRDGVHTAEGSWSPKQGKYIPRPALAVYQRQHFPENVAGSGAVAPLAAGTEVFKNEEVRVWTLDGQVLIASITAKLHLISPTVAEGLQTALEKAEAGYKGLVIWSPDDVFSAGANLEALMPVFMKSGAKGIAPELKKFQDFMLRVRYAQVPVISAIRGIALGGGCELAVYSSKRVAAMESYMGLVEVGVGLVPGAGGLTYIARRAAEMAGQRQRRGAEALALAQQLGESGARDAAAAHAPVALAAAARVIAYAKRYTPARSLPITRSGTPKAATRPTSTWGCRATHSSNSCGW